ncbi:MAG TPA: HesA/MoeB/ThiF family protein [Chitinophagaceae bacterium]|jgi:adenylyltransferase/sulfurtransferase
MHHELLRYSCQLALPGFSEAKQQLLQQAKVLIVGAGGLGCPAAQYLVAAGVGTVGIADNDVIAISNLHRQILYTPSEIGKNKALVAAQKLQEQNPLIKIIPVNKRVTADNATELIQQYDIIVDGTDNFDTRYLLNDACVLLNKPLVYGAIYQYEGQVAVWNILNEDGTRTPNYRDVFPEVEASQIPNCAEGGVIPTLAGIIGCMQANEVIKYITRTGELLAGKILILDAQNLQNRIIKLAHATKTNITKLPDTPVVATISAKDLKKDLGKNIYELVDIRSDEERTQFNIGGKHIPLLTLKENLNELSFDKATVFYCASGKRSAEAVKLIKKKDPNANVFSLAGGLKAWRESLAEIAEDAE